MRLYQSQTYSLTARQTQSVLFCFLLGLLLSACGAPQVAQGDINVTVIAEGNSTSVIIPPGSSAQDAIEAAGIEVGLLDRSEPPLFTLLVAGSEVRLIRVEEDFTIEETDLPYETQTLPNESLSDGERRLIQPGQNGIIENTYRVVLEDGVEISNTLVKSQIIKDAIPEVVMVGSQAPFADLPIDGRLVYLSAGNAWVMEVNTGLRRPIVTTGDLDGRIFSLSADGNWLLYTRSDESEDVINTLWVTRLDEQDEFTDVVQTIDLEVSNVIHFAEWVPDSVNGIVFSTASPSPNPPGWQADNNLIFINFSAVGWVSPWRTALEPSSGGKYGWWGTDFLWSPDGENLAYARPDGIGLVDFEREALVSLLDITPLLTRSDWAWVPPLAWAPDNNFIFTTYHAPQAGLASPEESPNFDLAVVPLFGGAPIDMVQQTGMFASPTLSPVTNSEYKIAFLQAIIPTQSDTSDYRLMIMDRDGSNLKAVFPPEGAPGLQPQPVVWSPANGGGPTYLALIYQGNLWLIDPETGQNQQLTGDGLTTALDWK